MNNQDFKSTILKPVKGLYEAAGVKKLRWDLTLLVRDLKRRKSGYRFPSGLIHMSDQATYDHWSEIDRGHDDELQVKEWMRKLPPFTMVTYDGLLHLNRLVHYCETNNINGRFVETGTWRGGAFALMVKASQTWGDGTREFWGFDSFEGIPEPDANHDDVEWSAEAMKVPKQDQQGRLRSVNALVAGEGEVYKALKVLDTDTKTVKLFKGWFQETLPKLSNDEIGPVAMLRLDGDLYASTMVCLEKFEPLVVKGGIIIVDDWGLQGARQAVIDYYTKKYGQMPMLHFIDRLARYIQKN